VCDSGYCVFVLMIDVLVCGNCECDVCMVFLILFDINVVLFGWGGVML